MTLRADIDYEITPAHTIYGTFGVKVWVFKGEVSARMTCQLKCWGKAQPVIKVVPGLIVDKVNVLNRKAVNKRSW